MIMGIATKANKNLHHLHMQKT